MSLTSANAAIQIMAKAMGALNALRERAQVSKDTEVRQHINTLYDELLSLKELVIRISDENAELRQKGRSSEPELRAVGAANYYFDGDKGPCCQPCYDRTGNLTVLSQPEPWNGGIRRHCVLCGTYFYETPMKLGNVRLAGRRRSPWV